LCSVLALPNWHLPQVKIDFSLLPPLRSLLFEMHLVKALSSIAAKVIKEFVLQLQNAFQAFATLFR
jgi:hypothetical protein